MRDNLFQSWRIYQGKEEEDKLPLCPVAAEFQERLEKIIFKYLGDESDRNMIARAKYLLTEEFMMWRKSIPARHRASITVDHHLCLDQVFDIAYDRLHVLHLRADPTPNPLIPERPPVTEVIPPVVHELAATLMGELTEDPVDDEPS